QAKRTYFWGPDPNTIGLSEQYNEDPRGARQRLVQYFDKSRMELNNPGGNQSDPFFVTNGLLTVELISGFIQVGEKDFIRYRPACIPMSGDFGDRLAPTYFGFQKVSNTQAGNNPAQNRVGQRVTETIDRNGVTGNDPSKGSMAGTEVVQFINETKHNIPRIFWDFLNSSGPTHADGHRVVNQQLIQPWFFASGFPISEAYWAKATIRGQVTDVMIQAYERRALTYVPTNDQAFQVEMANIGQHAFEWRYRNSGLCPGDVARTPTAPAPIGTITVVATVVAGSPTAMQTVTASPTRCTNCPTPSPTATIIIPPGTVVQATITTPTPTRTTTRTPTPKPTP
ncbi:MAG: hypothetical protein ABIO92_01370, partial [Chloroflexia bacterium]